MSLTKKEKNKILSNFFKKNILKISKERTKNNNLPLNLNFDPNVDSYYVDLNNYHMKKQDFEECDMLTSNDIALALEKLWDKKDDKDLKLLVPEFQELLDRLKFEDKDDSEISDLVYVMF
tara:strand:- start:294 stop:653 length:360 start_codon:yes stop_codon:yes gene_type:complete